MNKDELLKATAKSLIEDIEVAVVENDEDYISRMKLREQLKLLETPTLKNVSYVIGCELSDEGLFDENIASTFKYVYNLLPN